MDGARGLNPPRFVWIFLCLVIAVLVGNAIISGRSLTVGPTGAGLGPATGPQVADQQVIVDRQKDLEKQIADLKAGLNQPATGASVPVTSSAPRASNPSAPPTLSAAPPISAGAPSTASGTSAAAADVSGTWHGNQYIYTFFQTDSNVVFEEYNPTYLTGYGSGFVSGRTISLNYVGLLSSSLVNLVLSADGRTLSGTITDPNMGQRPISLTR
jgi:hypothetical protein